MKKLERLPHEDAGTAELHNLSLSVSINLTGLTGLLDLGSELLFVESEQ